MSLPLEVVILGLSITSSWNNGHAALYRGLVWELARRGHQVLFLERDLPGHADRRDLPNLPGCRTELYRSLEELRDRFTASVRNADLVLVGSGVPEGTAVGDWVLRTASGAAAFYDLDTPITLAALARGGCPYLTPDQVPRYDAYFTVSGGAVPRLLESRLGSPMARPLRWFVDPEVCYPEEREIRWDLGFMGPCGSGQWPALQP